MTTTRNEHPIQLVWFKRDLRVSDHRPLFEAAQRGAVLPLYIIEPAVLHEADYAARHYLFTRDCLLGLRQRLADLGMPLVVRYGEAISVLQALHDAYGIAAMWAHEETGNDVTYARDRAVRRWTKANGIPFTEYPNGGVVRRLKSRDDWAGIAQARMEAPSVPTPKALRPVESIDPGHIPELPELDLPHDPLQSVQKGGETVAQGVLRTFLAQRGQRYHKEMSSPVSAFFATSRLSPHLAYGAISVRQVYHALQQRKAEIAALAYPTSWKTALEAFQSRIYWRDHFIQKLEDAPRIEFEGFVTTYDGIREDPSANDFAAEKFAAWREGRTGYPLVDASMRALTALGFMNFRMRAMLVSFASHTLWLHWRATGLHLGSLFTDHEPGIHWCQMQMQSGSSGNSTLRIYNPTKQAQEQDPDGVFIRRWVPELGRVPDGFIHAPWLMPAQAQAECGVYIGQHYPAPIVDHDAAAKRARQIIGQVRKLPETKTQTAIILAKHGSRRRRDNRQRGRRKRKNAAPGQLTLNLGE
jgi:deoxyribodipyrimidine photo-lyase